MSGNSGSYFKELQTIVFPDTSSSKQSRYKPLLEVIALEWNSTATRIAYSRTDRTIRIWKLHTNGEPTTNMPLILDECHEGQAEDIAWKPNTELILASVGKDPFIKLWNTVRGTKVSEVDTGIPENFAVAFSGDSQYVACASRLNYVTIADPDRSKIVQTIKLNEQVYSITWSNTSSFLFVGLSNGSINVYSKDKNFSQWGLVTTLRGHRSGIKCLRFEPRARYLFAGSNEGVVSIWDLETLIAMKVISDTDETVSSIDVTRDGAYIAVTYGDGEPGKIYSTQTQELVASFSKCKPGKETSPQFKFCPLRSTFVYSSQEGDIVMALKK